MEKKILICENHQHFKVPVIETFAFAGAEYWCPYCGEIGGMLGFGKSVKENNTLIKRYNRYKNFSKDFLHAIGTRSCNETLFNGKWMEPDDLPEYEKQRLQKIIDDWKYGIKLKVN